MSAIDTFQAFKFVKNLTTPFDEWKAYELGLIDDSGKRLKKAQSSDEKDAMDKMTILARNVKRLLQKIPGGNSKIASMAAALLLLKENQDTVDVYLSHIQENMFIAEEETQHYDVFINNLYTIPVELFEDVADVFGVVKVTSIHSTINDVVLYNAKDIVSRKNIIIPESLLELYK